MSTAYICCIRLSCLDQPATGAGLCVRTVFNKLPPFRAKSNDEHDGLEFEIRYSSALGRIELGYTLLDINSAAITVRLTQRILLTA